ncbi:MAG: AMP-binding protein, partial [Myxococcota bacterium]
MGIDGTMLGNIQRWANARPDRPALHTLAPDGSWSITTWRDYWQRVRSVGKGLVALGLEPGNSAAMVAKNRPEWVIVQHGITAARGIPCPIYTTNLADQVAYIVDHSESEVIFLDEHAQLEKVRDAQSRGKAQVKLIITFDVLGVAADDVLTLAELEAKGEAEVDDAALEA